MKPLEAAWEAVLAAPDDDQALLVLADALMERGDPHGELIRLQLMGADSLSHVDLHLAELFGDKERFLRWSRASSRRGGLHFSRGFLDWVEIESLADLSALIELPIARLLPELGLRSVFDDPIEAAVDLIANRGPRSLTSLDFGWAEDDLPHSGLIDVAKLTAALPRVTDLTVGTWSATLAGARSPSLTRLELNCEHPIIGLGNARLDRLARLALRLPFRGMDLPPSLLGGEVAPTLKSLTIWGALWPQQLRVLAQSPLLERLTELRIGAEAETGWYGALLETIDAFGHLERIKLSADRHHPEWVQAVKAALPQVIIREPQLRL